MPWMLALYLLTSGCSVSEDEVTTVEGASGLGELVESCSQPGAIGGSTCTSTFCDGCQTNNLVRRGCTRRYPILVDGAAGLGMETLIDSPCPAKVASGACVFSDGVVNGVGTVYEVDYYYGVSAEAVQAKCAKPIRGSSEEPGRFLKPSM